MSKVTTPAAGAIVIPEAAAQVEHDSTADLDRAVAAVAARKDDWLRLDLPSKIMLLDQLIRDTLAAAEEWNAASLDMRGVTADSPAGGEEIATGPLQIVRHARLLKGNAAPASATAAT
jgi:acyl-CoA reductase-like NAD-dependent aldehyde dehydrogenase